MKSRLLSPIRRGAKRTRLWQGNALILREFKYFPRIVLLALLFTLLAAAFEGLGIGTILTFLQGLTDTSTPPLETGIDWIDVWVLGNQAPANERLYRLSGLLILVTLCRSTFTYFALKYAGIGKFRLGYQLRMRIFEQLQSLPLGYFAKTRSGELINCMTNEVQQIMQAFDLFNKMVIQGTVLLVYLSSMFLISWQLSFIAVILFSMLSSGVTFLLKRVRRASVERSKASSAYVSVSLEFINGIRTVQAFAAHAFERRRFDKKNQEFLQTSAKTISIMAMVAPLIEGLATTIIICMVVFAITALIPQGTLQLASLLTFLFILFRMLPLVKTLNATGARIMNFHGSFEKISEILNRKDKVYLTNGYREFSTLRQAITFEAVDFGYDSSKLVLRDINLMIERGKTTALVGASGAGKSTLVDLIARFYDPNRGKILIDGIDLREFKINAFRRHLAIVSQDTFIFNDTIRNNIAYAMESAADEDIYRAAQLANAIEFIRELPEGVNTVLGDRGVRLSGGQRQRIAIARALLRDPDILILDEATSALDSVSEQLIQKSIEKLSKGRTVIAIAHRLSTITRADKVVVLGNGQMLEQGTYEELLSQRGQLWEYHNMQYRAENIVYR
ncbi:MAG: heterocyst formation ABC transporter subunit HepA [Cyanobacteria bacterium J06626_6]